MTVLLNWIAALLIVGGAFFMLVAAVGLIRLPDLLLRMHAATKAGTLGAGLLLAAIALIHGDAGLTTRAIAAILFLMLTAPIAAHAIGRAAYIRGIHLWDRTAVDELEGRYDAVTHEPSGKVPVQSGPSSPPRPAR